MQVTKPLSDGLAIALVILLAIEIVAGFVGNLRICLLLYKRKELRKVPHILLGQLSITGLLVNITFSPALLTGLVVEQFQGRPAPTLLCTRRYSSSHFSHALGSLTLVAMAVDRHDCVCRPFKRRLTAVNVKKALLAIWCIAVVLAAGHVPLAYRDLQLGCLVFTLKKNLSMSYGLIVGNSFLILTSITIFITMLRVVRKLRSSEFPSQSNQRSEDRVTKLSLGVMAVYVISMFPLILLSIVVSIAGLGANEHVKGVKLFLLVVSKVSFVINPFLHSEMCKSGHRVQDSHNNGVELGLQRNGTEAEKPSNVAAS